MTAIIVCAIATPTASAATTTLLPNGVFADNVNVTVNGCVAPKSQCIDEAMTAPNDADTLRSSVAGPQVIEFDLTTITSVYRLHALEVGLRARCLAGGATRTIDVGVFNAAGVQQGTTQTFTVTDTWGVQVGFVRSLALTQATVDGLRLRLTTGACSSGASEVAALAVEGTYAPLVVDEVLVPNAPGTGSPAMLGGCAPNAWSCVAQPYGTGDATYIENTSGCFGSDISTFQLSDPANRVREVVRVQQGARAQMENTIGSSNVEVQALWPSGNTTNYSGGVVAGGAWQTKEAGATTVSLTEIQIKAATARIRLILGTCVKERVADINVKTTYGRGSFVSGTALDAPGGGRWSECDGLTANVTVAVDGVNQPSVACNATTGAWSTSVIAAQDSIVTAYLNDPTTANNGGVTYTKLLAESSDLAGVQLVRGEVRIKNESITPVTRTDLVGDDAALDAANVPVTVTGSAISVAAPATLVLAQGDLAASTDTLTVPRLRVDAGASLTSAAAGQVTLTGSGTGACSAGASARPLCVAGSIPSAPNVRHTGTGVTAIDGTTPYRNLELQPASGSPTYQLGSADDASLTVQGALTIGTGSAAVTASTTTYGPTLDVLGATSIATGATLSGSGAGLLTLAGDLTGGGAINLTGGEVDLRGAGTASTLSATGGGAPWQFATLTASTSLGARTVTIPAASRGIGVSTQLQVGRAGDADVTTWGGAAATQALTVTGNVSISSKGVLQAPPLTVVSGNAHNGNVLTPGAGVFRFQGGSTSVLSADIGTTGSFYDLEVLGGGKVLELSTDLPVSHGLTITGTSCAAPASLRAALPGPVRTLANTGSTATVTFGSFRDISAVQAITATSGGELGGTSNITFGTPCAAPTGALVDGQDAAGGLANTVAGATAFPMSFVNAMSGTADRQRTRVMSTPLDNVVGLWHLDTVSNPTGSEQHTPNAVAGGLPLITDAPFYTPGYGVDAGPSGHATSANLTAGKRIATVPGAPTAVFDSPDFTVEAWFRTSTLANGQPSPEPMLVERGSWWQNRQFSLYFDGTTQQLHAGIGAGGTGWDINTGATPYLDDSWHHVALTVVADASLPGPGEMRLYVDGEERAMRTFIGAQATQAGITNNAVKLGEGDNGPQTRFVGKLDEIRFSNVARTQAEIRGYLATKRAHGTTMWQTAAPTGDLLTPTCTTATRCANVAYGGAALADEGRWYAQQQLRTPEGLWTAWSTPAPFETRAAITVTASGPLAFGPIATGVNTSTSTTATVTCGAPTGCDVFASGYSDTTALDDGGPNSIPRHAVVEPAAPAPWALGVSDGMGISVASTTSGKDTGRWGAGTLPTHVSTLNYLGMTRTPSLLASSTTSGVESVVIAGRMNPSGTTAPGTYSGILTITAVPNL